jgi:glycosyltransferase involved in cell wall biosynthesis
MAIFRAMAAAGVDVELMDPNPRPWNPLFGLHPIYMGLDPLRALKVLTGRRRVDVVVSVFESSLAVNSLLRRMFGFTPAIAMWDIAPSEKWKVRQRIQNLVVPRVDRIFLLGSAQRDYIERKWGAGARCRVVWQHVDTEFYRPQAPQPNGPILAIGDDHGRDFDTLIAAVAELNVDIVIKTRRPLAIPGGCRARIRQIKERLSFEALRDLYAAASFVVVPLKVTLNVSGVGSSLEAMAMGKALIASDNPPLRDYLDDGRSCLVVPPSDPRKLRQAIEKLLADPDAARELGQAGRAKVERTFANPVFAARLGNEFRHLAEENVARRRTAP